MTTSDFRPGNDGFGRSLASRPVRTTILAGVAWTLTLGIVAVLLLCALVRLTHHQPRPAELRGTIQPSTYVPPLGPREKIFASLTVYGGAP